MSKFFSVIISAYNSREMIGDMLQSIVNQKMPEDIEVIISDDCSTEPYDDVIDKFRDELEIKVVQTDYNYCPANTRQRGAENATGEWMVFADHDDAFLPNAFRKVKQRIEETNERYYLGTSFVEINPFTNQVQRKLDPQSGWSHGKWISRKNLWEAFNLHYKKDLTSHEDIYLSSEIQCALRKIGVVPNAASDIISYCWRAWPKSQSKSTYTGPDGKEHNFLMCFYRDYIASTGDVYLNRYKDGTIDKDYAMLVLVEVIGYCYFYTQSFIFREPQTYIKKVDTDSGRYVRKVKKTLGITNADIIKLMAINGCALWYRTKESSRIATGDIIEPESFLAWLHRIDKK